MTALVLLKVYILYQCMLVQLLQLQILQKQRYYFLTRTFISKQRWSHAVDQGIYNGGGIAEGPYVAISKVGKGKAAFIGDSSLVEDSTPKYVREDNGRTKKTYDGFKEQDNSKLLKNITTWFGKQDHTPNLKETGIKLDQPTPLLNFEQPQHSTEPEKNHGHNHLLDINGMIVQHLN